MLLDDAVYGYLIHIRSNGFSEDTVKLYTFNLKILQGFLGNREMETISKTDLESFFLYLREVYHKKMGHPEEPLSGATMRNFWKSTRSLFRWSKDERVLKERPDLELKRPRNNPKIIMPLEEHEIRALLKNVELSRSVEPNDGLSMTIRFTYGDN